MTRKEFTDTVTTLVQRYIENYDSFDSNPQVRVNPATLAIGLVNGSDMLADIEYSNEAIEDAAAAERAESEDATDFQVSQNPDFYAVKRLLRPVDENKMEPDTAAIAAVADIYFK